MLVEERATVQLQKRCDMIKIVIHHDLNNEEINNRNICTSYSALYILLHVPLVSVCVFLFGDSSYGIDFLFKQALSSQPKGT